MVPNTVCSIKPRSYTWMATSFSGRTNKQTEGTRSRRSRHRSRIPRCAYPRFRACGSTQTCCLRKAPRRRPRGRLGLEPEDAVLEPEPRAPVLDLHALRQRVAVRSPADVLDPDLFRCAAAQAGTSRSRSASVALQPRVSRRRRRVEDEHRLARPVVARPGHARLRRPPTARPLRPPPHDHMRLPAYNGRRARVAPCTGRHDVRTDAAERRQAAVGGKRREPSEPASARCPRQEDALDRLFRAEGEDLVERRIDGNQATRTEPRNKTQKHGRIARGGLSAARPPRGQRRPRPPALFAAKLCDGQIPEKRGARSAQADFRRRRHRQDRPRRQTRLAGARPPRHPRRRDRRHHADVLRARRRQRRPRHGRGDDRAISAAARRASTT